MWRWLAIAFVSGCGGSTANTWADVNTDATSADSGGATPVDSTGHSPTGSAVPGTAAANDGGISNGTAQDGAALWTCNACKSDLDCQTTCPVGGGTTYCCNVPFGTCYAVGGTCPSSPSTTTTNTDSADGGSDGSGDGGSKKKKKDG